MRKAADVICMITKEGKTIPLKFRVTDEDGEVQTYSVKSYRMISHTKEIILPNEVTIDRIIWNYECKINVWGKERIVSLCHHTHENVWYIDV